MGAEIKDEAQPPVAPAKDETPTVFGDPASYEHLSMEERKAMTERMKNKLQGIMALKHWSQEKKDA